MSRFARKSVLVTGATGGIGRATALAFAAEGARLVLTGRNRAAGEALADTIVAAGGEAVFIPGDAATDESARHWVQSTIDRYGRIDVAVNNAGIEGETGPLPTQSDENFDRIFDTNVRGVFRALRHQLPAMAAQGGGAIVNVSSIAGLIGFPGASAYAASKEAVNGLTRTAALEYARQGVRVNAVAPGAIQTEMLNRFTGHQAAAREGLAAAHPVGRVGAPEEVAAAILFLASDAASFAHGVVLPIDGGYTAQ